jgi:hypothetical protein
MIIAFFTPFPRGEKTNTIGERFKAVNAGLAKLANGVCPIPGQRTAGLRLC